MFVEKPKLFVHPDSPLLSFDAILQDVYKLPVLEDGTRQSLEATYDFNGQRFTLACHARVLQTGAEKHPVVVFLPWYGGKSEQAKKYFGSKRHKDWEQIGIDIFSTKQDFDKILATAIGAQYAYALTLRMMAEQVHKAHEARRRVGMVGFSYGANVLIAYITHGLELPDAIAMVAGGSIYQTTLQMKYRGHDSDPRTLAALEQNPGLVPHQKPLAGKAAAISAAVINPQDKVVMEQEELLGKAASKMYIGGKHFTGPVLKHRKIRTFIDDHFEKLLSC